MPAAAADSVAADAVRQHRRRRSEPLPVRAPGGCRAADAPAAAPVPLPPRHLGSPKPLFLRCDLPSIVCPVMVSSRVGRGTTNAPVVVLIPLWPCWKSQTTAPTVEAHCLLF